MEQLKSFVAACETGSFSAAARKLGKVQSVVSTQIQNMELDLDLVLFDRSGKYPKPTAAARPLISLARQVIAQASRFAQAASSYQCGEESSLSIIFEELVMPDKLNDLLAAFAEVFTHTQLTSMTGVGSTIIEKVSSGEVDFALMTTHDSYPEEVDFINLGQQRVLMLASPDHPLVGCQVDSLNEVANYRQISTGTSQTRWQLASQVWICDSVLQALELVSKGVGWAYAPYEIARPYLKSGKLLELSIANARNTWTLGVDLLWSSRTPKGVAAKWFAREAGRLYGNYYSQPIDFLDRT